MKGKLLIRSKPINVYGQRIRPVHIERPRYGSHHMDGQNWYATHSVRHSVRQKDQRCRPSMLHELFGFNRSSVEVRVLCQGRGGQGGKSSLIGQKCKMATWPVIGQEVKMANGKAAISLDNNPRWQREQDRAE